MADGEPGAAAAAAAAARTTSSASADAAVVSESLEGLVSAVDELKRSMGLGEQVDLSEIERFILKLRTENEEFQQFAEEAIKSAQRLKEERDELQQRLDQVSLEQTMGAALAETQKLKDVADEFERDLHQQKLAEAEARAAEADALRERIAELEEENAGLTQTLNEFRQTTQQLQRLQSHEVRRLQAVEREQAAGGAGQRPPSIAEEPAAAEAVAQNGPASVSDGGSGSPAGAAAGSTPRGSPRGSARGGRRSLSGSPAGAAAGPAAAAAPSAAGAAAVRLAVQLEDVAGGAESGLLAEAAVALRELSKRDADLAAKEQARALWSLPLLPLLGACMSQRAGKECARLRAEVDELNDTMFSKTFKPPSAWAEREIKYKSEKKWWEEQQKEQAARLAGLSAELEAYRGASKAGQLEERIQELEAALVQSQREKDSARAQLHELQLSMRREGEFGEGGKRLSPYKGPVGVDASEGHEVQQLVDHLEHAATPAATAVAGSPMPQQRLAQLEAQLAAAAQENAALRRQLAETAAVEVPESLQGELGGVATAAAVLAAAAGIEGRLRAAEAESEALRQHLAAAGAEGSAPAAAAAAGEAEQEEAAAVAAEAGLQVQELQARAAAAEAAGDDAEAAALRQQADTLAALGQRAAAAEQETASLRLQLQELQPVRLTISTAAAAAAAADGEQAAAAAEEQLPVPPALQGELGTAAPAAAIEAKAAELEAALGEATAAAGEVRVQLRIAVAADQAAQDAAQQQRVLEAQLAAPHSSSAREEEVEALQRQLAALQLQKEAAQAQLWQLSELQEQLAAAEGERRRLAAALRRAQPVSLQLAVGEAAAAAAGAAGAEEPGDAVALRAQLAEAQQHSEQLREQLAALQAAAGEQQPVRLALRVEVPGDAGEDAAGGDATARLAAAEAEVERLRQQLADLQPIRLRLQLKEDAAQLATPGSDLAAALLAPAPGRAGAGARRSLDQMSPMLSPVGGEGGRQLTREASDSSLGFSSEQASALSKERAAADAAWREHQKATDVPALLRAKAELETRCQMLESQLAKMQGELESVDATNAVFEDQLDTALRSGDVSVLSGLKDSLAKGRNSLGRRMFKRGGKEAKGASPSKDTLKHTVHEMQDALTSSEEEKNALRRQLAKLSKKYQQVTQQQAHTAGIVAGAAAASSQRSTSESPEVLLPAVADADSDLELLKLREENQMLMEHVVMVKVRQAEMEGEYLESKRQLLRTREKNLQLARKLADVKEAAERGDPLPLTPRHGSGTATATVAVAAAPSPLREGMAAVAGEAAAPPKVEKKESSSGGGLLRMVGLGS